MAQSSGATDHVPLDETAGGGGGSGGDDDSGEDGGGWENREFLASLRRARLTTPLTRVLLVVLILGAGFLAGAFVQRHRSPSTTGTLPAGVPASVAQLFRGGGGVGGAGGGGLGGGGFGADAGSITGTVKLVDGANLYLADAQGNVTKVATDESTQVEVTEAGELGRLAPATSVVVKGTRGPDGTYTATSVTETVAAPTFPGAGPSAGR